MKTPVPPPLPEYLQFLLPYGPQITELALATRASVLAAAPGADELIYDAYNAVASGYSFTGRPSDAFIHIAVYARWVNLGFNFGSRLADAERLLQGKGAWVRHIRISSTADLEKPGVRRLVEEAVAMAERPEKASGPAQESKSLVRAIYANRRRPARPQTRASGARSGGRG